MGDPDHPDGCFIYYILPDNQFYHDPFAGLYSVI